MHPILFHIGSIPVRSYGALIVIGFLIGLWRAMRLCARRWATEPTESPRHIHPDAIFRYRLLGLGRGHSRGAGAVCGPGLEQFAGRPIEALKFWEGGLSLHGGMFFGILYLILACRAKKVSILAAGDVCGYVVGAGLCHRAHRLLFERLLLWRAVQSVFALGLPVPR